MLVTPARDARFPVEVEAALWGALADSLAGLALADCNMLRFRHSHRLSVEQLAALFCIPRAAVVRQLGRIRQRVLRDLRRGLAARLALDRHQLDRLLDVVRDRLDLAITRVLGG